MCLCSDFRLLDSLKSKEDKVSEDINRLKAQEESANHLLKVLREYLTLVHDFYVFDEDQAKVERLLQVY